jgi:hypothetical protein
MSSRLFRSSVLVAVLAIILGSGIAQGLLMQRWSSAQDSTGDLDRLPLNIGDWAGTPITPDPDQFPKEELDNVLLRRYVNRATGSAVTVFLKYGRPGPIAAAHAPDSCYPGAGYTFSSAVSKIPIPVKPDVPPHEFRVATFSKTERATPVHLRVFWSWSSNGIWQIPEYPRLTFASARRLYKMYVIRELIQSGESLEDDPAISFIKALAPEMGPTVFAGS